MPEGNTQSTEGAAGAAVRRAMKHQGLGRGLGALIRERGADEEGGPRLVHVAPENVRPNPGQPRKHFDEAEHAGLVETVRERGVLQPLLVRRTPDGYEIVAGERRWRAARAAGLTEIPVQVIDADDDSSFEMSLIENLQRKNLDPIEEALGYQKLIDMAGYTHDEIAGRVGKDRPTISNALRLLKLSDDVRDMLVSGSITPGHGRALLGLPTETAQRRMAEEAAEQRLSVRELERRVQASRAPKASSGSSDAAGPELSPDIAAVQRRLERALMAKVRIRPAKRGTSGKIEVRYASLEEFERIRERMLGL